MMYPKIETNILKQALYVCGGWMFTTIMCLCVAVLFFTKFINNNFLFNYLCFAFLGQGIISIFFNIIPSVQSGLSNDAYNLLCIVQDKVHREAFDYQLKMDKKLLEGLKYCDLSSNELFKKKSHYKNETGLMFYCHYVLYLYYLTCGKMNEVLCMIDYFKENCKQYPNCIQRIVEVELLYIGSVMADTNICEQYNLIIKNEKNYEKNMSFSRALLAYYSYQGNNKAAVEIYNNMLNYKNVEIYKGCNESEIQIAEQIMKVFL